MGLEDFGLRVGAKASLVVLDAGNTIEALRLRPDLVLLDITMPQMGGLEALRLIKKELPETRVVMLTVSDDDADLTLVTLPGAGHFVQHGAADVVTGTLRSWLLARTDR